MHKTNLFLSFLGIGHPAGCVRSLILGQCLLRLSVNRHFSLLNVNVAGACGYDFRCDGGRLVRAYLRR